MVELLEKGGDLVKPSIVRGYREFDSLTHHADFLARRDTQEMLKTAVIELMDKYRLDAVVYPFKSLPPEGHLERGVEEKDNPFSSVTGLPALLVPAGYTRAENGPIAIEFLGRPFSEPTLFKLAYAYEQQSHNRKTPATTPPLPGERFEY
jgi:Asp-tRNA(Asn)/Glu-tRNA(Gln) amidotransferase A subunit family amidase